MQNTNHNNYKDRRIFERFPLELPVRFIDLYRNQEGIARTVDVSAKGMGLITGQKLTPYTPLELWVDIPNQSQPFYSRAEVVWSKALSEELFRVGVNFEEADLMGVSQLLRAR